MAGQTKMIIITSDEDIIRQFSLNQTNNVHIFDFNNVKQTASNQNEDTFLSSLARLTNLPQSESNTDQLSKQTLDSSKVVKSSRKSLDIICVVCGDRAIGFNYDALSCGSCKAFFRRNANKSKEKIRCSTGRGRCSIGYEIQRKCTKCRLERCFAVGMRKDFLQTEEQKEKRRKCLEQNRNIASQSLQISLPVPQLTSSSSSFMNDIDNLLMEMGQISNDFLLLDENNHLSEIEEILCGSLSVEDRTTIENLQSSYISFFRISHGQINNKFDLSNRLSAVISWSNFINQIALRYINFIRQINEFEQLCLNDRIILIKYNLFPVLPLSKCFNYKQQFTCPFDSREEAEIHLRFFSVIGSPDSVGISFLNTVVSLVQVTGQDPTLLSLLLLILFFTPCLSMSEDEPPLTDPLAVHRAQSHYTKILWCYLINQYGEIEACRRFNALLSLILRLQSSTNDFRQFFREQCTALNVIEQITPLMQSVLNIS